jgi:hypothetical protein
MSTEPPKTFYKVIHHPKTGRPRLHKATGHVLSRQSRSATGQPFVKFTAPTPLATFGQTFTTLDQVHSAPAAASEAAYVAAFHEYLAARKAAQAASDRMRKVRQLEARHPEQAEQPQEPTMQAVGGHARASKLSPERRREIAQNAAKKRWEKGAPQP